jgi:methylthioribose-1-phosphate isomerase
MRTVYWENGAVRMIDQRRLPHELALAAYDDYRAVARAIGDMVVRGAPAIGAAGAFGLALAAQQSAAGTRAALLLDLQRAADELLAARPTAVNLRWALERLQQVAADERFDTPAALRAALLAEAERIAEEDVAINRRMGAHGAALIADGDTIVHHCNTGALATVDYGTALGVIRAAHEQGRRFRVLVGETRPRLQGAKLTTWELQRLGVEHCLIADGAAGHFLRRGEVQLVLVGADRVAANGDVANKIGTYALAVVARENGVPFYVVAPTSTVDLRLPSGDAIPIEERDPRELTEIEGVALVPAGTPAANPAFDVTPQRYVTGIVTEAGIVYPPFGPGLRRAVAAGGPGDR